MADKWPLANGNWSNAANWNDGTKPVAGDVVYADGKTVTIDEDATVAQVTTATRSGGTAGGGWNLRDGVTLAANVYAGITNCVTYAANSPATATINGNLFGSTTSSASALLITGTGNVNITGNSTGGSVAGAAAIIISAACSLSIVGNLTGGSGSNTSAQGLRVNAAATIVIAGDVLGGTGRYCRGIYADATANIAILGNVEGSNTPDCDGIQVVQNAVIRVVGNVIGGGSSAARGIHSTAGSDILVTGNVYGGSAAFGIHTTTYCRTEIRGNLYASTSYSAWASSSVASINIHSGNAYSNSGIMAFYGINLFLSASTSFWTFTTEDLLTDRTLYTADNVGGNPATSDVRFGTAYGPASELTGTCHVPAAASVLFGVPVDATTGTATIDAASIRAAVGLAEANLDEQFAAIEVNPQSIRDAMTLPSTDGDESIDEKLDGIVPLDATQTEAAAAAAIAGLDTNVKTIADLLRANRKIDQTTTPWQLVLQDQNTGDELLRYNLLDADGNGVDSIETFIAEQITPV